MPATERKVTLVFMKPPGEGPVRVLYLVRVSSFKGADKSDSIEAQEAALDAARDAAVAQGIDARHIATAVDKGVSGWKIDIFDREGLGRWLEDDKLHDFDQVWVTKLDRSVRLARGFLMFNWKLKDNGKKLFILNDPGFRFETAEDEVMAHMKAVAPQKEVEAIAERAVDSHARRKYTAAWASSIAPYGYISVYQMIETPQGMKKRKTLEVDPHMQRVIRECASWLINDDFTLTDVTNHLNDRDELTAKDWGRVREGRQPGERLNPKDGVVYEMCRWSRAAVKAVLSSPRLIGVKMEKIHVNGKKTSQDRPMLNPDGTLFKPYPPVLTQDEYDQLLAAIKERERPDYRREHEPTRLGGIVFCGQCFKVCTTHRVRSKRTTATYRYYRCTRAKNKKPCPGVAMNADALERYISAEFLLEEGENRDRSRRWDAGEDHTAQIKEKTEAVTNLGAALASIPPGPAQQQILEQLNQHNADLIELQKLPQRKAGWVYQEYGPTFGEMWPGMDWEARRKLLVKRGVKYWLFADKEKNGIEIPPYWPGEEPVIPGEVLSASTLT
ncbi:recombinase family protein [Streptomyces vinaceus]|uniref:recombinase family protein n=1 Tax=Streptomyces vinaceus TaxID=1960 RepID=UPI00369C2DAB